MIKCVCDESKPYIFVSYSHNDSDEVHGIITKMYEEGYNIWFDEGIDPGTEWADYIASHIKNSGYLIAFISNNYISSNNCKDELDFARECNIERLIVYLEEIELPGGIQMRINRVQAIHKYTYSDFEEFFNKIKSTNNFSRFLIKKLDKNKSSVNTDNTTNRFQVAQYRTILNLKKYKIEKAYFDEETISEFLYYEPNIAKQISENGPYGMSFSGFIMKLWFKDNGVMPDIPRINCTMAQICDEELKQFDIDFKESPIMFPMKKEDDYLLVRLFFVCNLCNDEDDESNFVFCKMKRENILINMKFLATNTFVDESFTLCGRVIADECEHSADTVSKTAVSYVESNYSFEGCE